MTCSLLILTAQPGRLAKAVSRRSDGTLQIEGYDKARMFDAYRAEVSNVEDLAGVVQMLASLPGSAVVRGDLTEFGAGEVAGDRPIRRILRDRDGDQATIRDTARHWLMLDIDSHAANVADIADDPPGIIEEMIAAYLPACFADATCWWQLSSSCGYVPDVAKAHLWFWLETPRTGAELKLWAEANAPDTDHSVFSPAQLLYTADAIRDDDVSDPLPIRGGWRWGEDEAVSIPRIVEPPREFRPRAPRLAGEGVRPLQGLASALQGMGDGPGLGGFHAPLRRAAMLYAKDVVAHGRPRDDESEIILLQSCVQAAPCRDGRRDRYLSDYYLRDLIRGAFEVVGRD